jgi:hypothetical protein
VIREQEGPDPIKRIEPRDAGHPAEGPILARITETLNEGPEQLRFSFQEWSCSCGTVHPDVPFFRLAMSGKARGRPTLGEVNVPRLSRCAVHGRQTDRSPCECPRWSA